MNNLILGFIIMSNNFEIEAERKEKSFTWKVQNKTKKIRI